MIRPLLQVSMRRKYDSTSGQAQPVDEDTSRRVGTDDNEIEGLPLEPLRFRTTRIGLASGRSRLGVPALRVRGWLPINRCRTTGVGHEGRYSS